MAAAAYERFKARIRGQQRSSDGLELLSQGPHSLDGTSSQRIPLSDETQGQAPAPGSTAQTGGNSNSWARGALGLFEKSNPHKGIERFGIPLLQMLRHYIINDPFTTLLTAPRGRFISVFFCLYMAVYLFFACIYIMFPSSCMNESTKHFGHAFWFSFQTASTIGYSGDPGMYPNPDCDLFNLVVMVEIIGASLLDYCLMGAVFARFAAPLPKSQSIRFSANALLCQPDEAGGLWQLSFRMASIRKHSLLKPEVSLLLAIPEGPGDMSNAALKFKELEIDDSLSHTANLRLGLPVIVEHTVTPSSPLFDLSLAEMERRGVEIICFLDGMDPMTSNSVQARHSYRPYDIRMNEVFSAIGLQANWRGEMGLDFTQFDKTVPRNASTESLGLGVDELRPVWRAPHAAVTVADGTEEIQEHMQQLRAQTLRSLSINGGSDLGATPRRQHLLQQPPQQPSPAHGLYNGQYDGGVGGTTVSGHSWTGGVGAGPGARGMAGGAGLSGTGGGGGGGGGMAGSGGNGRPGTWGGGEGEGHGYGARRDDPLGAATSHNMGEALSFAHAPEHLLPSAAAAGQQGQGAGSGVGAGMGAGCGAAGSNAALGPQTAAFLASILSDPNVGADLKEAAARLQQQRQQRQQQQQGGVQQSWPVTQQQQQHHAAVLQLPVSRPASSTDAGQGGARATPAASVQGIKSE